MKKASINISINQFIAPAKLPLPAEQIDAELEKQLGSIGIKDTADAMKKIYEKLKTKVDSAKDDMSARSSVNIFFKSIQGKQPKEFEAYITGPMWVPDIGRYKSTDHQIPQTRIQDPDLMQTHQAEGVHGAGVQLSGMFLMFLLQNKKIDANLYTRLWSLLTSEEGPLYGAAASNTPRGYLSRTDIIDILAKLLNENGIKGVDVADFINAHWREYKNLESRTSAIMRLVKLSNALDLKGFFVQAEVVDVIIKRFIS